GAKRSKTLAGNQLTMLSSSAFLLCDKVQLMYSTCALSPLANDGIIEAFLNNQEKRLAKGKCGLVLKVVDLSVKSLPYGHATKYGHQFLPNETSRIGPIYLCLLERL